MYLIFILLTLLLPQTASAHSFGVTYTLPIPIWMYLYGGAASLACSFLIIGLFTGASQGNTFGGPFRQTFTVARGNELSSWVSLALLLLTMATGLFGTENPYANFSMTFFWVVFLIGYGYWSALAGASFNASNPWLALSRLVFRGTEGIYRYPRFLAYWPALLFYMALVWFELFARARPAGLGMMLAAYTLLSLVGCRCWGAKAWFRYCDIFGVMFRTLALISPINRQGGKVHLAMPFVRLTRYRCENFSLLVFILFMLSSTAFDGLHETVPWVQLYWVHVAGLLKPFVAGGIVQTYPVLKILYACWQTFFLILSPLVYLSIYALFIALSARVVGSRIPVRTLSLEFAYTLLPIALAYHASHYFPLLVVQGPSIVELASDPFGLGWNLFGTRHLIPQILPDVVAIWHTQVFLIVFGHIISVYLCHMVAVRLFQSTRAAVISQIPMLFLMMCFTTAGLWILSLPVQAGLQQ